MVSNAIDIDSADLYATLERLRVEHAQDPEYMKIRNQLPADWPL
jgi:hypothetical protein